MTKERYEHKVLISESSTRDYLFNTVFLYSGAEARVNDKIHGERTGMLKVNGDKEHYFLNRDDGLIALRFDDLKGLTIICEKDSDEDIMYIGNRKGVLF